MLRAFEFRLGAPPEGWPERSDGPGILWIPLAESDAACGPGLWVAEDRATGVLDRDPVELDDVHGIRSLARDGGPAPGFVR